MARIITYNNDLNVTHLDKWIGTDANNGVTKNFKASDIGVYLNNYDVVSLFGEITYKFISNISKGRGRGTITLPSGGGDGTGFSSFENVKINKYSSYNNTGGELKDLSNYIEYYFKYKEIVIYDANDLSKFGHYGYENLVVDSENPDYYDLTLRFIQGYGGITHEDFYVISGLAFGGDKHYRHDQDAASDTWVITHNLQKYPSISVVDSANNIVVGDTVYNSINQLTIYFTGSFSGKAYLN